MSRRLILVICGGLVAIASSLGVAELVAQEMQGLPEPSEFARQSLRPYWHVFIAYSLVIVMVSGWIFSIAGRLKDVERRLAD